jgi:hypothetical protein
MKVCPSCREIMYFQTALKNKDDTDTDPECARFGRLGVGIGVRVVFFV